MFCHFFEISAKFFSPRCRATRSECIECPSYNGPCARFSGLKGTGSTCVSEEPIICPISFVILGGIHLTGCVGWKRDAYFLSSPDLANKILSSRLRISSLCFFLPSVHRPVTRPVVNGGWSLRDREDPRRCIAQWGDLRID